MKRPWQNGRWQTQAIKQAHCQIPGSREVWIPENSHKSSPCIPHHLKAFRTVDFEDLNTRRSQLPKSRIPEHLKKPLMTKLCLPQWSNGIMTPYTIPILVQINVLKNGQK